MSVAHITPAPAEPVRRTSVVRWLGGGALAATVLTALTIAVWPASEVDKARTDGEQVGQAVAQLQSATSSDEVDAALGELDSAVSDTADHAGDNVSDQVNDQVDALDRAVDGFAGANSSDDGFEQDLYDAELDVAVDDLASQADSFRTEGPEVQQAFWDGVDAGLTTT